MKTILLACLMIAGIGAALLAQQPPAMPPGTKGMAEPAEAEILKVYTMQDQGATFRAYVVKYKGNEVIASDDVTATTTRKVGDKVTILATRVELQLPTAKIHTFSFRIFNSPLLKKK